MKKVWKITLIAVGVVLAIALIGPFLIPIPALENTQPAAALADADSQFVAINGLTVHYKTVGSGEPAVILLHGFGASAFSWREVMQPLSAYGQVVAYDRPAFGLTERPLSWEGVNPYSEQGNLDLLSGLMDALDIQQAILVGNSAGGTVATAFALEHPERVLALIEVDAAIYQTMPESALLSWLLKTPQIDRLGPLFVRRLAGSQGDAFLKSAWYDPSELQRNPETIAGYRKPLRVENWDRALWEHTRATSAPQLADRLHEISVPTLVISGQADQIVPVENSRQLAADIPGAALVIIPACGHVPQEECPQAFMLAVDQFMRETIGVEK